MDIFTAPSRWEAGPYAVLEAMASGLPVVASAVAGHQDYMEDDHSGLLVEAELPDPLDGALRALLIDADRREFMGRAARHRVEQHFTLCSMVAHTAELYREVIAEEMR
jgi:glycosyltransferase involved in cell wall biosynthesis